MFPGATTSCRWAEGNTHAGDREGLHGGAEARSRSGSPQTLDVQLTSKPSHKWSTWRMRRQGDRRPGSNGGAIILKEKELAALSDDPDELSQQLQAMAGSWRRPEGGQIYIDGFTGGNLPSKSSIREIRINSNPFSPEYDRPGFGRIEIFTKPGTDSIHGQAFFQYNKEASIPAVRCCDNRRFRLTSRISSASTLAARSRRERHRSVSTLSAATPRRTPSSWPLI